MTKAKKPKTASNTGYGILNPYGDMWTSEIFDTPGKARGHLERFWRGNPNYGPSDLDKFKIVRAKQTSSYVGEMD